MNSQLECGRKVIILLVEDDPGDQELTRRALQQEEFHCDLRIVNDGEEAMQYLLRQGAFTDPSTSPIPDLILMDLNMPRMNGREVLSSLREHPDLSRIPVVVLTTSQQETDILKSYDLGCSSYIQKPVEIQAFMQAIRKLGNYWFDVVTLPTTSCWT